jgi:glucose/mannose-6-phosphate isomerase
LVVLSSYSGTTEEVLVCGKEAFKKKAKLAGLSAGGQTAEFLKRINTPCYVFNPILNPSGQPRIGGGYLIGGHLGFLIKLGLINISKEAVFSAINSVEKLTKEFKINSPTKKNFAKQLAEHIYGRYPYFIVSEFLSGVGNGLANQTNETAKAVSSFRIIPELNHHLMEGLKFPAELKKIAVFVFFYSSFYSTQVKKRFSITKEVVEQNGIKTIWRELNGKNEIEQAFELMALGSYFSMYLSALYRQNPTTIPFVDYFKQKLKEMK